MSVRAIGNERIIAPVENTWDSVFINRQQASLVLSAWWIDFLDTLQRSRPARLQTPAAAYPAFRRPPEGLSDHPRQFCLGLGCSNRWFHRGALKPLVHLMELPAISFSGPILRPFSDSDAENFTSAVLESVESVSEWMPWCSSDYTARHALDWFAACRTERHKGTAFEFGVFCENSGQFLGGAGLTEIRQQHKLCNLGYWVRQSRQRQGVAS